MQIRIRKNTLTLLYRLRPGYQARPFCQPRQRTHCFTRAPRGDRREADPERTRAGTTRTREVSFRSRNRTRRTGGETAPGQPASGHPLVQPAEGERGTRNAGQRLPGTGGRSCWQPWSGPASGAPASVPGASPSVSRLSGAVGKQESVKTGEKRNRESGVAMICRTYVFAVQTP